MLLLSSKHVVFCHTATDGSHGGQGLASELEKKM